MDTTTQADPSATAPDTESDTANEAAALEHQAEPAAELDAFAAGPVGSLLDPEMDAVPGVDEFRQLAALAVTLAGAQLVPKALQNRPNDVLAVLLTAREMNVGPMAAIREFHPIDGRVTISPKMRVAMVRRARLGRVWPDPANNATSATWHATRADEDHANTYSFTFTADDARVAKLDGKDNHQKYPGRMLSWRAAGYLLDDVFGEVGTGLYTPDELGAITDEDGQPVDATGWETPPGVVRPPAADADKAAAEQARQEAAARELAERDAPDLELIDVVRARIATLDDTGKDNLRRWWDGPTGPQTDAGGLLPLRALPTRKGRMVHAKLDQLGALTHEHLTELAKMAEQGPPTTLAEAVEAAGIDVAQDDVEGPGAPDATPEPAEAPSEALGPDPATEDVPATILFGEPAAGDLCVVDDAPATVTVNGDPYCADCAPF